MDLATEQPEMEENVGVRRQGAATRSNPISSLMPKMEIPLFEGNNPQWWMRRCEKVFNLYNVAE